MVGHSDTAGMASTAQWSELLEEEAYLVQAISDTPLCAGALEHATDTLAQLRADLDSCSSEIATLERDIRNNQEPPLDAPSATSTSRFVQRVKGTFRSEHHREQKEHEYDAQTESLFYARVKRSALSVQIQNFEDKAQTLLRRERHHEEMERRLSAFYERVFDGRSPSSPEEGEADKEVQRGRKILHQTQRDMENSRVLVDFLTYGHFALSSAGSHLSQGILFVERTDLANFLMEFDAAKVCATQACIVVNQAKRLDPAFFEQNAAGELFNVNSLSKLFRDEEIRQSAKRQTLLSSHQELQKFPPSFLPLIDRARGRLREYEENSRRVAGLHAQAYGRKQMLRRRVLLRHAGIDGDSLSSGSRGRLTVVRGISAGLDKLIPAVVPPKLTNKQDGCGEERKQVVAEGEARSADLHHYPQGRVQDTTLQTSRQQSAPDAPRLVRDPESLRPQAASRQTLPLQPPSAGAALPYSQAVEDTNARGPQRISPRPFSYPSQYAGSSGTPQSRQSSSEGQPRTREPIVIASAADPPGKSLPQPPNPDRSQPNTPNYSTSNLTLARQPPKVVVGILKKPPSARSPSPLPDLADPWGVKAGTAGPSRSRTKIRDMLGMLRAIDPSKSRGPSSVDQAETKSDPGHGHGPSAQERLQVVQMPQRNPRASMQSVRFVEEVAVIHRPAIDSEPYDEDDDYADLPPSPTIGSTPWHAGVEDEIEDDDGFTPEFFQRQAIQIDKSPRQQDANVSNPTKNEDLEIRVRSKADTNKELLGKSAIESETPSLPEGKGKRVSVTAPRAYVEQSSSQIRGQLEISEDAKSNSVLSSDTSAVGSAQPTTQNPAPPLAQTAPRGRVGVMSDHELVQVIFPSPRTTGTNRDLLFTG